MRRVCYAVLLTGLFLLMLSALVVTPEMPSVPEMAEISADLSAEFRPLVSVLMPEMDAPRTRDEVKLPVCLLAAAVLCACLFTGLRDANGRILNAARYENSVYQLFRPEVAGG